MKVTKQYRWLAVDDFQQTNPITGQIKDITEDENGGVLCILDIGSATVQFTLFRDAVNALIDKRGDDTEKWKGARLQILRAEQVGGKVRKTVSLL